ncbi:hypothetical protein T11_14686 [Trichinella zimbabwensis]|uniref:Uncharacterized protein n=1 Tax=Trichinella zimbabwensis TaxID=268475 RepID=A0A0V1H6D4_9BILA|nr:hypothetical protein T11_14686 [Trichinella zimbabwensis]
MFTGGALLRQRKSLEQKKGKAFFTCSLHNSFKTPLWYLKNRFCVLKERKKRQKKKNEALVYLEGGWMQLTRCVGCCEFSTRTTHIQSPSSPPPPPPLSSFRLLQHEELSRKNECSPDCPRICLLFDAVVDQVRLIGNLKLSTTFIGACVSNFYSLLKEDSPKTSIDNHNEKLKCSRAAVLYFEIFIFVHDAINRQFKIPIYTNKNSYLFLSQSIIVSSLMTYFCSSREQQHEEVSGKFLSHVNNWLKLTSSAVASSEEKCFSLVMLCIEAFWNVQEIFFSFQRTPAANERGKIRITSAFVIMLRKQPLVSETHGRAALEHAWRGWRRVTLIDRRRHAYVKIFKRTVCSMDRSDESVFICLFSRFSSCLATVTDEWWSSLQSFRC